MRARLFISFILTGCLAVSIWAAEKKRQEDPQTVEMRGKVVCLTEEIAAAYDVPISARHEHLYGMKANGIAYTILRNKFSEAIFSDSQVREKELVIKGRVFPHTQILEITSLRSLKKGVLHELYYYCEICEIMSVAPGICECCQGPTELVEKPLK